MADKSISELTQATQITNDDLFVLQQNGEARKLLGATLLEFLTLNVISVTVTTLPAGSAATATFNKTTGVLALGIPKGDNGTPGTPGATGPANTLSIGAVTSGDTPSASITGTAPEQELSLVLPKGDPGTAAPTITGITVRQSDYHLIVTLSNGTNYDAGYCRGASGAGTGDMQAETYDPQGKNQDVFAYVDNQVSGKLDKTGDGSDVTVSFTPPGATASRTNLVSGEKLSAALAKVYQWFANLGTLAFKSSVAKSDLASDVQTSLGKADSALQSAPVTSVNGQTGAVQLDISSAVSPSDATPQAPTESGSAGTAVTYARGDHKHPKEVFWATYNTTTYAEIKAAYEAGKMIACEYNGHVYCLTVKGTNFLDFINIPTGSTSTSAEGKPLGVLVYTLRVTANGWNYYSSALSSFDAAVGLTYKVTLTSSGWDSTSKQQTVTVSGVLADTTKQETRPAPVDTSYDSAWNSCGVMCVAQAANSLTFQCSTVPTADIEVYVTVRNVNYQS